MEVKSCNINNHFFCMWKGGSGFFVEDMKKGQKVFLSISMARWFEISLKKLLSALSVGSSLKEKADEGVIHLSKFCVHGCWFMECAVWPSRGGRKNIHVPFGADKDGRYSKKWLVFVSTAPLFPLF